MPLYRCVMHTGPTAAKSIAQLMKAAKLKRVMAGTELVYADVHGRDQAEAEGNLVRAMKKKHGRTVGLERARCNARHAK